MGKNWAGEKTGIKGGLEIKEILKFGNQISEG